MSTARAPRGASRIETERLVLRPAVVGDAAFLLELYNEPAWIEHIGDKGLRTVAEVEEYFRREIEPFDATTGSRMFVVRRKDDGLPVGITCLVDREGLDGIDLGFAFLAPFRGQGLAEEAARATMEFARAQRGLDRLLAVTTPTNEPSRRLLDRLGFRFERRIVLPGEDTELELYSTERV